MIVKQIKGKGFYGCLKYVMEKAKANFLDGNVYAFDGIRRMAREFRLQCSKNHRVKRVVYHATLSIPSEDKGKLNDVEWGDLGRRFLEKMNFSTNFDDWDAPKVPYIIVRHNDKDHDHIHIVAGRVRTDGTCVSDSWDYRRGEKAVRELEVEFGLSQPFKQTNRKSPHPYLVEKLERIYQNSDDSVVSTDEKEKTPDTSESDSIAHEVDQLLQYRRQLQEAKKEDKKEARETTDSGLKKDDYSMSSLIAKTKKTPDPSPQTTEPLPTLINEVCQQVNTIPELLKLLKDKGVEATIKLTRNKCVQGIIYHHEGQRITGTHLGPAYTFPGLRKRKKLQFQKHHIPEIEAHNRSCQALPTSLNQKEKWQWLQDISHRVNQWLTKTHRQQYHDDHFDVRRDRDWLTIASNNSDFFVKARYDLKKRQWLPQSGWRFNTTEADEIRRKVSDLPIANTENTRRNLRRR